MANKSAFSPGDQINSWTILSGPHSYSNKPSRYLCRCKCGYEAKIITSSLTCGQSKSCLSCSKKTHSQCGTRLYNIWKGIKSRCFIPKSTSYKNYGARGITICNEWLKYEAFHKWAINNGYSDELVIDRRNNNQNYTPQNCRWITNQENSKNTSRTHLETAFEETKCFEDWIRDSRCNVHPTTLRRRLKKGMNFQSALL